MNKQQKDQIMSLNDLTHLLFNLLDDDNPNLLATNANASTDLQAINQQLDQFHNASYLAFTLKNITDALATDILNSHED